MPLYYRNEIGCEPIRRVALSRQTKELVVDAAEVEGWQREHTAAEVTIIFIGDVSHSSSHNTQCNYLDGVVDVSLSRLVC